VQLDSTQVVVRERSMLELLDLSLHVLRHYGAGLLLPLAAHVLPFALWNALVLHQLTDVDYADGSFVEYIWLMILLVYFQAQWATSLATLYLGKAIFLAPPTWNELWTDYRAMFWQLVWCQGLLRLALPATLFPAILIFWPEEAAWAHGLLTVSALVVAFVRAWRPYINEIVLLERNPLFSSEADAMTVGRRSALLHDPSAGELIGRWIGVGLLAVLIGTAIVFTLQTGLGTFFNQWGWGPLMLHLALPASLWLIASYVAVLRFLSYLDLRIRREGWEVELKMRAESVRLTKSWI
jgi:hypothetical protein